MQRPASGATGDLLLAPVVRPLAGAVGAFYLGLAALALAVPRLAPSPVLVAAWGAGGLALLAVAGLLAAWRPGRVGVVAVAVAAVVVAEGVLLLAITRTAAMTVVLEITLLGTALLLHSRRQQAALTAVTMACWLAVALAEGGPEWVFWGITLVAVAAIAGLAQHTRLVARSRLEALRRADVAWVRAEQRDRHRRHEADFKAAFLQMAAHELSTPLTPLLLQARILRLIGDGGDPRRERSIEAIERSAHRLQAIVEDMLDVIRYESGYYVLEPQELDLARLAAEEAAQRREDAAQKGLRLEARPPEGVVVHADPGRIRQTVRKLLDNALKFTPGGGEVVVTAEPAGEEARLVIHDTGPGLSRDQVRHLFEAFTAVESHRHRPHTGPGLGLAVARLTALAHGGRLEYADRPGGGAVFTLVLPVQFKGAPGVPPP